MFYVWLESLSLMSSSLSFYRYKDLRVIVSSFQISAPALIFPVTVSESRAPDISWHWHYVLYLPGQDQYWHHAPGGSGRWNAAQCCEKWAEWRVKESDTVWEWLTGRWRVWSRQPGLKWNLRARRILWRSTQTGPTIIWRKQRWQYIHVSGESKV